jgi:GT2 family glycosyltransferase
MAPELSRSAVRSLAGSGAGSGAGAQFDGQVPVYARIMMRVLVPAFRMMRMATGCFVYATRSAFDDVGGFDETLFASEEVAFSKAMKWA